MKRSLLLIMLFFNNFDLHSQNVYKDVLILSNEKNQRNIKDSDFFFIQNIDSLNFINLINENQEFVIQFWQPWCHGVSYWIDSLKKCEEQLKKKNIKSYLISDNRYGSDYLKNDLKNKDIGMLVYYYNKYFINFPTYIIPQNKDLDFFKNILAHYCDNKLKQKYFCYYIKNRKIIKQNYSKHFYYKDLQDILK